MADVNVSTCCRCVHALLCSSPVSMATAVKTERTSERQLELTLHLKPGGGVFCLSREQKARSSSPLCVFLSRDAAAAASVVSAVEKPAKDPTEVRRSSP